MPIGTKLSGAAAAVVGCMTYRFKLSETVAGGASRIGLEQIDIAEARLASREDIPAAIHDARRCLKRLRALLRLIRPALAAAAYRREANRIAAIGRLLADVRDQHVMQQTLAKLEARFKALPKGMGVKLAKLTANGAGARSARAGGQERRQALKDLEHARAFFARLERRPVAFDHLADGIERSYRRARRAFREAYATPTDEAFHEWRKTVQQHWRHMQLISRAWPDVLSGRAGEAKELSRLLGDDHDVHVLLAFAADRGKAVLAADELAALGSMGRTIQDELRRVAQPRGARLFAEPAADLRERLALYWSAACDLTALAPPNDNGGRKTRASRKVAATRRPRAQAASRGSPPSRSRRAGQ
ncbi:MAG: CHAD domain-containing protein [Hyphomonadaceae bacterium]|nr:CHAD domain-containing protein [Hyphomonadaceae bacterium]